MRSATLDRIIIKDCHKIEAETYGLATAWNIMAYSWGKSELLLVCCNIEFDVSQLSRAVQYVDKIYIYNMFCIAKYITKYSILYIRYS